MPDGQRLPFPLLGIDSDNGREFTLAPGARAGVNDLVYRYCLNEQITFTRSRPYQKNDQAHVEHENWSVVRHTVGYDCWETKQQLALLESIYADLRLYINFFQPSLKLIAKERVGNKTIQRYDTAKTLTRGSSNAMIFLSKPKPGSPNCGVGLTGKLPNFGRFLGNILP